MSLIASCDIDVRKTTELNLGVLCAI